MTTTNIPTSIMNIYNFLSKKRINFAHNLQLIHLIFLHLFVLKNFLLLLIHFSLFIVVYLPFLLFCCSSIECCLQVFSLRKKRIIAFIFVLSYFIFIDTILAELLLFHCTIGVLPTHSHVLRQYLYFLQTLFKNLN